MRHYVLTRSAYGPEWSLEENRRRLRIADGITARMMALQTDRDWTWVVLLHRLDSLLEERMAVFEAAAPAFLPILWEPTDLRAAPWKPSFLAPRQKVAATAYRAPWRQEVGPADGQILMTRLDDDDAFTRDALARVRRAALGLKARTALMFPYGYRVWAGRYSLVRHSRNAMHTLSTPRGDDLCVYDYGHQLVRRVAPIVVVDRMPAWLWTRHRDTISGWHQADNPITESLRRRFPVDWEALL